jgi:hypothetical protein
MGASLPEVLTHTPTQVVRAAAAEQAGAAAAGQLYGTVAAAALLAAGAAGSHGTLAGAGGFEPPYGGIKIRCLTAWRRPNVLQGWLSPAESGRTIVRAFAHRNGSRRDFAPRVMDRRGPIPRPPHRETSTPKASLRPLGQAGNNKRVALAHVLLEIMIAKRARVDALHPGQAAGGEIGRWAHPRQFGQYRKGRVRAFEAYRELDPARPPADREHLAADLPDARVAPLDDMRGVRQVGADRVAVFLSHVQDERRGSKRSQGRELRSLSELHRVLELTQPVELLLGQALLVFIRVSEVLLRVLDLLAEFVGAQVLERDGRLRQQD